MINPDTEKNSERGKIHFIRPLRDALTKRLGLLGLAVSTSFAEIEAPSDHLEPQSVMYPPDPEPGSIINPIK